MKYTVRDLFWLMIVAGLAVGWWCDRQRDERTIISGVVTDTANAAGLVEVSLGADDGLKAGDLMELRRGPKYLGQGVVRKVGPDRAVLQMKTWKRVNIQKGDIATFKVVLGPRLD